MVFFSIEKSEFPKQNIKDNIQEISVRLVVYIMKSWQSANRDVDELFQSPNRSEKRPFHFQDICKSARDMRQADRQTD